MSKCGLPQENKLFNNFNISTEKSKNNNNNTLTFLYAMKSIHDGNLDKE